MSPDVFVIGTVQIDEATKLTDFIRYYLDAGIPPSRILIGIQNDPFQTALAAYCSDIIKQHGLPFSQELSTEDSAAEWRQNIQDEYIQDEDWVIHANVGDLVHIPWSNNDFILAAQWMDEHQFDAVRGRVIQRYMRRNPLDIDTDLWYAHPISVSLPDVRMVMTRGYWYTCDDGRMCPEFEDSAWVLNKTVDIHRLTYEMLTAEDIDSWRIDAPRVD